jgi:hypothetical protein
MSPLNSSFNYSFGEGYGTPRIVTNGLVLNLDAGLQNSYNGGTTWRDLSGNGNNGTITGSVTYSSSNGGSLSFGGGYVNLGDPVSLRFGTGDYTAEIFTRPSIISTGGDGRLIYSKGYQLGPEALFYVNNFYTNSLGPAGSGWSANTWYHIAYTKISGSLSVYRNAVSVATGFATTNVSATGTSFFIGARASGGSGTGAGPYSGLIPIVRMYNRGLSENEVSQNYNSVRGRYGI